MSAEAGVGEAVEDRSIRGWVVDPTAGREGAGEVVQGLGVDAEHDGPSLVRVGQCWFMELTIEVSASL